MNNKNILIGAFIIILLFINFVFRPFLHKRESFRIVDKVLSLWEEGDIPSSYFYWDNPKKMPPVTRLLSHEIIKKEFYKKDRKNRSKVTVIADFGKNENLPAGKWIFELSYTDIGWKIVEFYTVR
ncbi:MAG: hypothetical protein A2Y06_03930 [Omnitrophica WOR_2 bacterium GWA2_37_7]|nr:MAG: hypothetical protein A2Y06_03930 [Omnitrophica WOR_2 bacterium GWA2_37_7]OGX49919.1 MAG: hypothetical protein A2243_11270 [Omnitrophica WOR_2 bacterium RIFOXYA2_FULL_38_17]